MNSRFARLFGCSAVWALCACGDKPTEVELRLFPCVGAPSSVSLTIQSYSAESERIGAPLTKTFPIDDPAKVFDDGFATVGFRPPEGTARADVTVVWSSESEEISATYNAKVPGVGEVLELGADECEPEPGTTTMMATTLDPTTVGTTETTGVTTDMETMTSSSTDTDTSTSTSTSTSTTDSTSDSTTTTGSTSTTSSTTDSTTGTTGDEPVEGGDCGEGDVVACTAGPGEIGKVLWCLDSKWQPYEEGCNASACEDTDLENPYVVGCTGGTAFGCVCAGTPKVECSMDMKSKCGKEVGDRQLIELCIEEDGKTWYYEAACEGCDMAGDQPSCTL